MKKTRNGEQGDPTTPNDESDTSKLSGRRFGMGAIIPTASEIANRIPHSVRLREKAPFAPLDTTSESTVRIERRLQPILPVEITPINERERELDLQGQRDSRGAIRPPASNLSKLWAEAEDRFANRFKPGWLRKFGFLGNLKRRRGRQDAAFMNDQTDQDNGEDDDGN